jgi:prephenate dehydrogenase
MGGSLARALKGLPAPPHIRALSPDPADLARGIEAGVVDEAFREGKGILEDRDLVVYATPLRATLGLMEAHRAHLRPGALVTDLVSLKAPLLLRAQELGLENRYVGSHPMVGGTGSGFQHSVDDLYRGARVWVVPGPEAPEGAVGRVRGLWASLGARPMEVGATEHDDSMTWVSHLPQLTGNALALALGSAGYRRDRLGSGGRDMTRLAGSSPELWKEILEGAPGTLLQALEAMVGALDRIRALLEARDWEGLEELMRESRDWVEDRS